MPDPRLKSKVLEFFVGFVSAFALKRLVSIRFRIVPGTIFLQLYSDQHFNLRILLLKIFARTLLAISDEVLEPRLELSFYSEPQDLTERR